jgi:hypothetical protein
MFPARLTATRASIPGYNSGIFIERESFLVDDGLDNPLGDSSVVIESLSRLVAEAALVFKCSR